MIPNGSSNIRESKSTFAIFFPETALPLPSLMLEVLNTGLLFDLGARISGVTSLFSRLHWNLGYGVGTSVTIGAIRTGTNC